MNAIIICRFFSPFCIFKERRAAPFILFYPNYFGTGKEHTMGKAIGIVNKKAGSRGEHPDIRGTAAGGSGDYNL